jgi:serine/threonine protein kinase
MAAMNGGLMALGQQDRQLVESWLFEFDRQWHNGRLADAVRNLPPSDSPLRFPALVEMVKIDLERQWQQGRPARIESYLQAYPELGTIHTVPADLIAKEYEVQCQSGAAPQISEFLSRFPQRAEQLRPLLEEARQHGTEAASEPKARETPRPDAPQRATSVEPPPSADLPERFGRYSIRQRLGQGGMGSVYLAHDTELDRDVALKVPDVAPGDGPEVLERFYREARAAATLQHPYICPVYDVGQVDRTPYLAMAYIEGDALSRYVGPDERLPARRIADLARKLALALHEAHAKGIVHRDLKPSNVMINKLGDPMVMDFGLVLRVDKPETRITQKGHVVGTPAYMSPEQVLGATTELGPACDVYSLGVVLYELLAGRLPFQGSYSSVCAQIVTQEPPPPSTHRADVDPKLEFICLKAMAKKPEARYATMGDLAAVLASYLHPGGSGVSPDAQGREPRGSAPMPCEELQTPEELELKQKQDTLAQIEAQLADRELELASLRAELAEFEKRYDQTVGRRYATLDELKAKIAEARAGQQTRGQTEKRSSPTSAPPGGEKESTAPSPDGPASAAASERLRKLYRQAAKLFHPDLTLDGDERKKRHQRMSDLNEAYRRGDEERVRALVREWRASPESVEGEGPAVELIRTIRKIAQVQMRLDALALEIDRQRGQDMFKLMQKVAAADARGRDSLAAVARRLDNDIAQARQQLKRALNKDLPADDEHPETPDTPRTKPVDVPAAPPSNPVAVPEKAVHRAPSPPTERPAAQGPLPDWLADVARNESTVPPQATPGFADRRVDWLEDIRQIEETLVSNRRGKEAPRPPVPSEAEALLEAQRAIQDWVDAEANKPLVVDWPLERVVNCPEALELLARYERYGPVMQERLRQYLTFLVDNRRKFYNACRSKSPDVPPSGREPDTAGRRDASSE